MYRQTLGELVRQRRQERRLSVRAAAKAAGLDRATWTGLEEGTRATRDWHYAGIERVLGWPAGTIETILLSGEHPRTAEQAPAPQPSPEHMARLAAVQLGRVLVAGGNYIGALNSWRGRLGDTADIPAVAAEAHRLAERPAELARACAELGLPAPPASDGQVTAGD